MYIDQYNYNNLGMYIPYWISKNECTKWNKACQQCDI